MMTTKILVVLCCWSACEIQTVSIATSESPEKSGIFSSHALQCWITVLLLRKTGPERCLFLSNHHHQTGDELLMNSGQIQKVFALALNEVNDRKLPDSHRSAVCSLGRTLALPLFPRLILSVSKNKLPAVLGKQPARHVTCGNVGRVCATLWRNQETLVRLVDAGKRWGGGRGRKKKKGQRS